MIQNCQAGDVDFVEFGKAKVDLGLPIFNVGLAMDQNNRIPLFYELYPGSINDVSQFKFMVDKAVGYGYKNIGVGGRGGFYTNARVKIGHWRHQMHTILAHSYPSVAS